MTAIDDLWLASYLISQGARLGGMLVLSYRSGSRMRAVFQLDDVPAEAIAAYSEGDPAVKIHALRNAINELRDLMYRELQKRHACPKQMPNGSNGKRRRGEHENRPGTHR